MIEVFVIGAYLVLLGYVGQGYARDQYSALTAWRAERRPYVLGSRNLPVRDWNPHFDVPAKPRSAKKSKKKAAKKKEEPPTKPPERVHGTYRPIHSIPIDEISVVSNAVSVVSAMVDAEIRDLNRRTPDDDLPDAGESLTAMWARRGDDCSVAFSIVPSSHHRLIERNGRIVEEWYDEQGRFLGYCDEWQEKVMQNEIDQ